MPGRQQPGRLRGCVDGPVQVGRIASTAVPGAQRDGQVPLGDGAARVVGRGEPNRLLAGPDGDVQVRVVPSVLPSPLQRAGQARQPLSEARVVIRGSSTACWPTSMASSRSLSSPASSNLSRRAPPRFDRQAGRYGWPGGNSRTARP